MSLTDESLQAVSCNNQTQNNQKCAQKKQKKHECVYYWAHTSWHTEQHRTVIVIFPLTSSGHAVSTSRVPSAVPVYMTTHKCFLSTCIRRDVIGDDQQQQQLSVITMLVCGVGVMSGNRMSTNSFCLHICLGLCVFSSVCPSVCLSVCLWAGLLVMLWINFCKVCVFFFWGGGGRLRRWQRSNQSDLRACVHFKSNQLCFISDNEVFNTLTAMIPMGRTRKASLQCHQTHGVDRCLFHVKASVIA